MSGTRVCVSGITGWIGRVLAPAISETEDLELVSAVSRKAAGRDISEIVPVKNTRFKISSTVSEALEQLPDVLVDYTSPDIVKENIVAAVKHGVHVVVGTSGLNDEDYAEIHDAAIENRVGVIAAGNFAISAALMLRFATMAAKYMNSWEVIDYASSGKIDSPSGTALELAYRLGIVSKPDKEVPIDKIVGLRESRGAQLNHMQVHSVRLPGFVIGADVIFGGVGEKLYLKFEGGNEASTYIPGTLLAIRKVQKIRGLVRGLDHFLDF